MKNQNPRTVLAFYSNEEREQAGRAYQTLQNSSGGAYILQRDGDAAPPSCEFYSQLRIEGETLVAVGTEPSKISYVVKTLRLTGTPSIFVVRPNLASSRKKRPELNRSPRSRREILARLDSEKDALDSARRDLREAARLDHALPPAAEWILDNSYLIRTQIAEVRQTPPARYRRMDVASGPSPLPAGSVPSLARVLVDQCGFAVNENNIRDFLRQRQTSAPLTIAELWAFPLFIRIALIEELTGIAIRVAQAQQLREVLICGPTASPAPRG